MKILLVGYYGKGNFGDDVLFCVTYRLARHYYPDAAITVLCDRYLDDYLPKLVGEDIQIVAPGHRGYYDLILHGGGGTFFDFQNYGAGNYIFNVLMRAVGFKAYHRLERFIRNILGRQRTQGFKRIGLGIGVGTYTKSSKKLKYDIPVLLEFDALVVRDATSIKNMEKLGITDHVKLGADLAFLYEFWRPENVVSKASKSERKKVGVVLRDWSDNGYLYQVKEMMRSLQEQYDFSIFVFDRRTDRETMKLFEGSQMHIWDPLDTCMEAYSQKLAQQDVLISSRAHGGLCGAVLGVPSVLINLEPKLKTIHKMLPRSTVLTEPEMLESTTLARRIEEMIEVDDATMTAEVLRNKKMISDEIDLSLGLLAGNGKG